jgi:asparagine synthase (glutamine-hydrolysing)
MCGIAGYLNLDGHQPADRARLERMTRSLVHRGPDEEGYYLAGSVALGIRRLRVIDLEGGKQPITNEDGTVWVVFNGEIYNFLDLRRELEPHHQFLTRSDTEVIVHLYEEQGVRCVESLRGMFAFALWDARARRLLLARDHMGKKPLYYARTPQALWFGSEIKAILAGSDIGREMDPAALDDYLALGYIPGPRSIFAEVRKLPPGSMLQVEGGTEAVRRYWRLDWTPSGQHGTEEALTGLRHRLQEAVDRRTIADVPLGAFLSGGIDSTAVVWMMAQATREPVKTFSIGFETPGFNELPYAREVARAFGTEHYEEVVKPDALSLLPELVKTFDEPFGDSSAIPTYLVSRLARQHVTVALSGDGGDEVFAGYDRYWKMRALNRMRGLLLGAAGTRGMSQVIRALPIIGRRARRISDALGRAAYPELERYVAMVGLYSPDLRAAILNSSGEATPAQRIPSALERAWADARSLDPIRRYQAVDTDTYLPDDILVKVDRASMAVSLEVRAPLLDHALVQYVAALPTRLKFRRGKGKWILRRLLEGHVPTSVLTRPKHGFSVPLGSWFRAGWEEDARAWLFDGSLRHLLSRGAVEKMFAEHAAGAADHGEHLWLLLVLAAWWDRYVGSR